MYVTTAAVLCSQFLTTAARATYARWMLIVVIFKISWQSAWQRNSLLAHILQISHFWPRHTHTHTDTHTHTHTHTQLPLLRTHDCLRKGLRLRVHVYCVSQTCPYDFEKPLFRVPTRTSDRMSQWFPMNNIRLYLLIESSLVRLQRARNNRLLSLDCVLSKVGVAHNYTWVTSWVTSFWSILIACL